MTYQISNRTFNGTYRSIGIRFYTSWNLYTYYHLSIHYYYGDLTLTIEGTSND